MKKLGDLLRKYRSIVLYLVFGVATTVVNWLVYIPCIKLCGENPTNFQVTICNAIAWVVAVTFAYVTNKRFVFESKCTKKSQLLLEIVSFFGARVFSGIFEIFLPGALITIGLSQAIFGVEGAVAKAITSVVVILLNYLLSKLVIFRKKRSGKEEGEERL